RHERLVGVLDHEHGHDQPGPADPGRRWFYRERDRPEPQPLATEDEVAAPPAVRGHQRSRSSGTRPSNPFSVASPSDSLGTPAARAVSRSTTTSLSPAMVTILAARL